MQKIKSPSTDEVVIIRKKPIEKTLAVFTATSESFPNNFHELDKDLQYIYTKRFVLQCLDLFVGEGYIRLSKKQIETYGQKVFDFIKEMKLPKFLINQLGRDKKLLLRNIVLHEQVGIFPSKGDGDSKDIDKFYLFNEIINYNCPDGFMDILRGVGINYEA